VPLLAGEEVIGALFAADRAEHTFSPEEISLLSAFADHAAVVLQTARLLARTQQAAEETQQAYRTLADHVEAMERASGVHTDLITLVLQGGDAAAVAAALGRVQQCAVTILDTNLRPAVPDLDTDGKQAARSPVPGGVWTAADAPAELSNSVMPASGQAPRWPVPGRRCHGSARRCARRSRRRRTER
jgi:hypothetical protein